MIENYEIQKYKMFLESTDYIIIKMYEELIKGNDIGPLKEKYKKELIDRDIAREEINKLQGE